MSLLIEQLDADEKLQVALYAERHNLTEQEAIKVITMKGIEVCKKRLSPTTQVIKNIYKNS